mmetsp:Transcript_25942/g.39182  ORF Transcript_25942/g.39182 Transcript_25942/m.39182 type:complete len:302 (+) Transcript_25942:159-1064(+)
MKPTTFLKFMLALAVACSAICCVEANDSFRVSNTASFRRPAKNTLGLKQSTTAIQINEIRGGSIISSSSTESSVFVRNILWSLATLVYVKTGVTTCDTLLMKKIIPADVSRKIIHLCACSWCLFWPKFNKSHWSWKLNVAIPALYSGQLFVKGAILQDSNDQDVKTMSRSGDPKELLYGPFLFTLIMLCCGLKFYMQPIGVYIMGCLVGDGIAPLVGKRYPKFAYKSWGNETKTLSGSVAMFVGAIMGMIAYAHLLGVPQDVDLLLILMIALVATVAEGVTGIWDNPAIALSVYWFVKSQK